MYVSILLLFENADVTMHVCAMNMVTLQRPRSVCQAV